MVILVSTRICERGFCNQNLFKSHLRISLKLETLDALMRISCANIRVENINWNAVMLVWRNMKDRCYKPLTGLQLTLNDQVKTEFIS
jgi:hypothetical protein